MSSSSPDRLDPDRLVRSSAERDPVRLRQLAGPTRPSERLARLGRVRQQHLNLVEHLLGNVVGAGLAIFGTFALGAYLAGSRATRSAMWGMTLAITGHVLSTVPGVVSTFATPAIGKAYLAGNVAAMTVAFSPGTAPWPPSGPTGRSGCGLPVDVTAADERGVIVAVTQLQCTV